MSLDHTAYALLKQRWKARALEHTDPRLASAWALALHELAMVVAVSPWPPSKLGPPCDHKFISSRKCLRCGWTPPALTSGDLFGP